MRTKTLKLRDPKSGRFIKAQYSEPRLSIVARIRLNELDRYLFPALMLVGLVGWQIWAVALLP